MIQLSNKPVRTTERSFRPKSSGVIINYGWLNKDTCCVPDTDRTGFPPGRVRVRHGEGMRTG